MEEFRKMGKGSQNPPLRACRMWLKRSSQRKSKEKTGHLRVECPRRRNPVLFSSQCGLMEVKSKKCPCARSTRKSAVWPPAYDADRCWNMDMIEQPNLLLWLWGEKAARAWPDADDKPCQYELLKSFVFLNNYYAEGLRLLCFWELLIIILFLF